MSGALNLVTGHRPVDASLNLINNYCWPAIDSLGWLLDAVSFASERAE